MRTQNTLSEKIKTNSTQKQISRCYQQNDQSKRAKTYLPAIAKQLLPRTIKTIGRNPKSIRVNMLKQINIFSPEYYCVSRRSPRIHRPEYPRLPFLPAPYSSLQHLCTLLTNTSALSPGLHTPPPYFSNPPLLVISDANALPSPAPAFLTSPRCHQHSPFVPAPSS